MRRYVTALLSLVVASQATGAIGATKATDGSTQAVLPTPSMGTGDPTLLDAYFDEVALVEGISRHEALERARWRQAMIPLIRAIDQNKDSFADAYRQDDEQGWTTVINYVGDLGPATELVADAIPAGAPIEWRRVARSMSELESLMANAERLAAHNPETVAAVGIDVRRNGIRLFTRGEEDDVVELFFAKLGPSLTEVVVAAEELTLATARDGSPAILGRDDSHGSGCASRTNCPTWRGGLPIYHVKQNGAHSTSATSNQWAKRLSGSTWLYYVLFSGHAIKKFADGSDAYWYHNGDRIGYISRSSLWDATYPENGTLYANSDSARIYVTNQAHGSMAQSWMYKSDAQKDYSLTSKLLAADYIVGDPMCKVGVGYQTGSGEYLSCGRIEAENETFQSQRCCEDQALVWVRYQTRGDFNGWIESGTGVGPGDSGAVIFGLGANGLGWAGIAAAGQGWFSRPNRIETDLQLDVCLDSSCT